MDTMGEIKKEINKAKKRLMIASDQLSSNERNEEEVKLLDEIIEILEKIDL